MMSRLGLAVFLGVFGFAVAISLKIQEKCIPTAVVRGPCHVCVCDVDGIYQCKEQKCIRDTRENGRKTNIINTECVPNFVFRDNNLICTCTREGFWKANECRKKFNHLREGEQTIVLKENDKTCEPNFLYLIDCNICRCSENGVIETTSCTSRPCNKGHKVKPCLFGDILKTDDELCSCSDMNIFIDRLCLKVDERKRQIINETALESIIYTDGVLTKIQDIDKGNCIPNTILNIDCNRCVCTEFKTFACTDRACVDSLKAIMRIKDSNSTFFTLPVLKSEDDKCTPGIKYRLSCNTCTCSSDAIPICTTMFCLKDYYFKQPGKESADYLRIR